MKTNTDMNTISLHSSRLLRTAVIDTLLAGSVLLIPAASHLTAWPLYRFNPMWVILLAGMLLVNDRRNSLLLAVALPLLSCLLVGMPTPIKTLCMGAEMTTLVLLYPILQRGNRSFLPTWGSLLAAMVCAKAVYYLLKLAVTGEILVGTSPLLQAATLLAYSLPFALISVATSRSQDRQPGRGRC